MKKITNFLRKSYDKKIESTDKWEKDFLNKQIAKPWIDGGYIEWKNKEFQPHIKDIEAL